MKILLFGKNSKNIEKLVKEMGFPIVPKNPEIVISYGGDGTLLSAERKYPGIAKLPIRDSLICNKCSKHQDEIVLKELISGKLKLKEYKKLETTVLYEQVPSFGSKSFFALNDFVIRNSDPTHTIRFKVTSEASHPALDAGSMLLIGDGIVVTTSFGSSGYFKSITGKTLTTGFGLAFNNTTQKLAPVFLNDHQTIDFKLIRGKATLSFDNNPDIFTIDEGSELTFKLSDQVAKIYEDTSLRCPNCQVIRG